MSDEARGAYEACLLIARREEAIWRKHLDDCPFDQPGMQLQFNAAWEAAGAIVRRIEELVETCR